MKDFMKLRYINILYSKKNIKINNHLIYIFYFE